MKQPCTKLLVVLQRTLMGLAQAGFRSTRNGGYRHLWQVHDEIDEDYAEAEIDRVEILRLRRSLPLVLEFF